MTQSANQSVHVADAFYKSSGDLDYIDLAPMQVSGGSSNSWFGVNSAGSAERRNSMTGGSQRYPVYRGPDFVALVTSKFKATLEIRPEELQRFHALENIVSSHLRLCLAQVLLEDDDSHEFQVRRRIDVAGI